MGSGNVIVLHGSVQWRVIAKALLKPLLHCASGFATTKIKNSTLLDF